MSNLQIGFLIVICFGLGALPLTGLVVRWISRTDLSQLGTGNVGVSAAFTHAGKAAGIAAALVEILRGITPVLLARFLLPSQPAWELVGLIALIAGRYWIGRGGGVTNATWGILIYFPPIAISVGLTGLVLWKLLRLNRLRGARWACASGPIWVWIWHQWPRQMPLSIWELMAAVVLASLLIWININQSDDLGLYMKRQDSANLDQELDPQRYGDKAARLSQLKQSGFQVPMGWVLPAVSQEDTETPKSSNPLIPEIHFPLIVRSSAIGEDTDAHSAAGQYQTISAVTDETELVQAIAQCRQSYWSNAAVAYRQERQIPDQGIAVLIQPYIASQVAGVMFSRNPLDGAARVIIEALPGGAEAVVGGQQTPLHLEIDISSIEAQEENLSRLDTAILPSQILKQLVELARRIEGFYHGLPQDIEWGWDGETIWIFQTRPITNLRPIWTRTIAAEVIPGAIRPLTWSINRPLTCGVWGQIFSIVLGKKAANLDFTETATLLGSHAYFNATLLGEIFRMMGLPEQGLEFLLRGQKMGKPNLKNTLPSLIGLLRLALKEIGLVKSFQRDNQKTFQPELEQLTRQNISKLSLQELLNRAEHIQNVLKPITYYNILGPIGLEIRKTLFKIPPEWLPNEALPEVASMQALQKIADQLHQTVAAQTEISSETLAQEFSSNSSIQQQLTTWLSNYSYMSEVGTDISVATWGEQPENFQQTLLRMAESSPLTREKFDAQSLNWQERWRLQQCTQRTVTKGQISEIYGKLLADLRWTILAIEAEALKAGALQQSGDIFFLEFSEVKHWIQTGISDGLQQQVQHRRQQFAEDSHRPVPTVVYGNILPEPQTLSNQMQASMLTGIPASVGQVEGIVKVCRSFTEAPSGSEKFILVVPYTDAGWAPLLLNAKAVLAEVGGQLSHGAIIAREYGIPAVMNIENVTTRLQDGQQVRVNGYRGTVEVLS